MDTNWIDRYKEKYGERWVIRELDFFPEALSELAYLNPELYSPSVYRRCCLHSDEMNWAVFKSKKEAILASQHIRRILGLPNSSDLENKLEKAIDEEVENEAKEFTKHIKKDYDKNIEVKIL